MLCRRQGLQTSHCMRCSREGHAYVGIAVFLV